MPFFFKHCISLGRKKRRRSKTGETIKQISDITTPVTPEQVLQECQTSTSASNSARNTEPSTTNCSAESSHFQQKSISQHSLTITKPGTPEQVIQESQTYLSASNCEKNSEIAATNCNTDSSSYFEKQSIREDSLTIEENDDNKNEENYSNKTEENYSNKTEENVVLSYLECNKTFENNVPVESTLIDLPGDLKGESPLVLTKIKQEKVSEKEKIIFNKTDVSEVSNEDKKMDMQQQTVNNQAECPHAHFNDYSSDYISESYIEKANEIVENITVTSDVFEKIHNLKALQSSSKLSQSKPVHVQGDSKKVKKVDCFNKIGCRFEIDIDDNKLSKDETGDSQCQIIKTSNHTSEVLKTEKELKSVFQSPIKENLNNSHDFCHNDTNFQHKRNIYKDDFDTNIENQNTLEKPVGDHVNDLQKKFLIKRILNYDPDDCEETNITGSTKSIPDSQGDISDTSDSEYFSLLKEYLNLDKSTFSIGDGKKFQKSLNLTKSCSHTDSPILEDNESESSLKNENPEFSRGYLLEQTIKQEDDSESITEETVMNISEPVSKLPEKIDDTEGYCEMADGNFISDHVSRNKKHNNQPSEVTFEVTESISEESNSSFITEVSDRVKQREHKFTEDGCNEQKHEIYEDSINDEFDILASKINETFGDDVVFSKIKSDLDSTQRKLVDYSCSETNRSETDSETNEMQEVCPGYKTSQFNEEEYSAVSDNSNQSTIAKDSTINYLVDYSSSEMDKEKFLKNVKTYKHEELNNKNDEKNSENFKKDIDTNVEARCFNFNDYVLPLRREKENMPNFKEKNLLLEYSQEDTDCDFPNITETKEDSIIHNNSYPSEIKKSDFSSNQENTIPFYFVDEVSKFNFTYENHKILSNDQRANDIETVDETMLDEEKNNRTYLETDENKFEHESDTKYDSISECKMNYLKPVHKRTLFADSSETLTLETGSNINFIDNEILSPLNPSSGPSFETRDILENEHNLDKEDKESNTLIHSGEKFKENTDHTQNNLEDIKQYLSIAEQDLNTFYEFNNVNNCLHQETNLKYLETGDASRSQRDSLEGGLIENINLKNTKSDMNNEQNSTEQNTSRHEKLPKIMSPIERKTVLFNEIKTISGLSFENNDSVKDDIDFQENKHTVSNCDNVQCKQKIFFRNENQKIRFEKIDKNFDDNELTKEIEFFSSNGTKQNISVKYEQNFENSDDGVSSLTSPYIFPESLNLINKTEKYLYGTNYDLNFDHRESTSNENKKLKNIENNVKECDSENNQQSVETDSTIDLSEQESKEKVYQCSLNHDNFFNKKHECNKKNGILENLICSIASERKTESDLNQKSKSIVDSEALQESFKASKNPLDKMYSEKGKPKSPSPYSMPVKSNLFEDIYHDIYKNFNKNNKRLKDFKKDHFGEVKSESVSSLNQNYSLDDKGKKLAAVIQKSESKSSSKNKFINHDLQFNHKDESDSESSNLSEGGDVKEISLKPKESKRFIVAEWGDNENDDKVLGPKNFKKPINFPQCEKMENTKVNKTCILSKKKEQSLDESKLTDCNIKYFSPKPKQNFQKNKNINVSKNAAAIFEKKNFFESGDDTFREAVDNDALLVKDIKLTKEHKRVLQKSAKKGSNLQFFERELQFENFSEIEKKRKESIDIFDRKKQQALSDMKPILRKILIKNMDNFQSKSKMSDVFGITKLEKSPQKEIIITEKNLRKKFPSEPYKDIKLKNEKQEDFSSATENIEEEDNCESENFQSSGSSDSLSDTSEKMTPERKRILDMSRRIRSPKYPYRNNRKALHDRLRQSEKPFYINSPKVNIVAYITKDGKDNPKIKKGIRLYDHRIKRHKMKTIEDMNYEKSDDMRYLRNSHSFRATSPDALRLKFDELFRRYAGKGRSNGDLISYKRSTEWLRDAGVIGKSLTAEEADDAFKCSAGVKIALNRGDYRHFLKKLSRVKRLSYNEIYQRLCTAANRLAEK